jgi:hypothetical protein
LKDRMPHAAVAGPAGKGNLADQLRLDPAHRGIRFRPRLEGTGLLNQRLQPVAHLGEGALIESRPGMPDVGQVLATVDAQEQGAQRFFTPEQIREMLDLERRWRRSSAGIALASGRR